MALFRLLYLALLPLTSRAFSFKFLTYPTQCQPLSLNWTGGTPPYELTFIALSVYGEFNNHLNTPAPHWNGSYTVSHNTTETSFSTVLPFQDGLWLVTVLSDATGFGTGGTSDAFLIVYNDNSSCVTDKDINPDETTPPARPFSVALFQPEPPVQCAAMQTFVSGNIQLPFLISTVIPGGESFEVRTPTLPAANNSSPPGWSAGQVNWTLAVPAKTRVIFLIGDSSDRAAAITSSLLTVGAGDSSCLGISPSNGTASNRTGTPTYSSTPAPAVGGLSTASIPATSSTASFGTPIGQIIGPVVGAFAGFALLCWFGCFYLPSRANKRRKLRRVRMLDANGEWVTVEEPVENENISLYQLARDSRRGWVGSTAAQDQETAAGVTETQSGRIRGTETEREEPAPPPPYLHEDAPPPIDEVPAEGGTSPMGRR